MKYIRFVSDIHLDFDVRLWHKSNASRHGAACDMDLLWYPEQMEGDDETTFIIPGDLWIERRFISRKHPTTGRSWIEMLSDQFKYVVFVLGNHDYWGQNFSMEAGKVKMAMNDDKLTNVYFLEKSAVVLDNVKFLGGTLWTDFGKQDPVVMMNATNRMNDYNYIRNGAGYRNLYPIDVLNRHLDTRNYISWNAAKDNPEQRVMIVTHMAPTFASCDPALGSMDYAPYYASDLSDMILDDCQDVEWWIHGHIHSPADYMVGNTRVMCNPRGYVGQPTMWDPRLRIEL